MVFTALAVGLTFAVSMATPAPAATAKKTTTAKPKAAATATFKAEVWGVDLKVHNTVLLLVRVGKNAPVA
jgi:hypothetical protein